MWRQLFGMAAIPLLMVACFFSGTLIGDSPVSTHKTQPVVKSPNLCGTEGDTCPMPWPPVGKMPWCDMPTGHEGQS